MMLRYPGKIFVITIMVIFAFLAVNNTYAQIVGSTPCNGSLGDPIVNVTFGSGFGFGPPLGPAITGLSYVTTMCPSDGEYTIVNQTSSCWAGNWHTTTDHTGDANGYFFLINASFQPSDFYVQTVDGLCDGTTYQFSAWILNMLVSHGSSPDVTFTVEKTDGTILGTYSSGKIPIVNPTTWNQYGFYFTTPPGISKVIIRMHNNAPGGDGNDLALDDIVFRPAGPSIKVGFTNATGNTAAICSYDKDSLRLTSVVDSCYISTAYQWQVSSNNGFAWQDVTGAKNKDLAVYPATTGTYLYRLKVAQAGNINNATCSVTSAVLTVTVNTAPPTAPAVVIAIADTNVCAGAAVTFTSKATAGGSSPVYQWLVNGTAAGTGMPAFTTGTLQNKDKVSCILTSNAACITTAAATSNDIIVTLTPLVVPAVEIAVSAGTICMNTPVTFTAKGTNGGSSPSYVWKINGLAATNGTVYTASNLHNADVVTCVMKNNAVCASADTSVSNNITMKVFALPVMNMGVDKTILRGNSVQLTPVITGDITAYVWLPAAGLDNSTVQHPVASPQQTTAYTLQVVSTDGCAVKGSINVTVLTKIKIPNVFSPNGDGINDTWVVEGIQDYPGSTVDVFNRYGQLVFHSEGYPAPWRGEYNGRLLPAGTYYYVINPKKGFAEIAGPVTIVR